MIKELKKEPIYFGYSSKQSCQVGKKKDLKRKQFGSKAGAPYIRK